MAERGRQYVGYGGRGHSASSLVTPVARRRDDGVWEPIESPRTAFPPEGSLEAIGVALREGEWVIFGIAPKNRPRATTEYRTIGARRLLPLLDAPGGCNPEDRRQLLVETGLEVSAPDELVVRISEDAVVRVRMVQCADARWRAAGGNLAALPVRRFDQGLVIVVPGAETVGVQYEYEGAEQLPWTANWSTDDEYLRAAAVAAGMDAAGASALLEGILGRRCDEIARAPGGDPAALAEVLRAGALRERLKHSREVLDLFRGALRADPVVQEEIAREAARQSDAEYARLVKSARAAVEAEIAGARAAAEAEVKAVVANLEADELARLQERNAQRAAAMEASLQAERHQFGELEDKVAAARAKVEAEIDELSREAGRARGEVLQHEADRLRLARELASLGEEERQLRERISGLERMATTGGMRLRLIRQPVWFRFGTRRLGSG